MRARPSHFGPTTGAAPAPGRGGMRGEVPSSATLRPRQYRVADGARACSAADTAAPMAGRQTGRSRTGGRKRGPRCRRQSTADAIPIADDRRLRTCPGRCRQPALRSGPEWRRVRVGRADQPGFPRRSHQLGCDEIRADVRLAEHPVGEQAYLGSKQRSRGDLEVDGVQGIPVLRDVPDKPARRGKPRLADAVVSRKRSQFLATASHGRLVGGWQKRRLRRWMAHNLIVERRVPGRCPSRTLLSRPRGRVPTRVRVWST